MDAQGRSRRLAAGTEHKTVGPWKLGKKLGEGSSGHVRLAKHWKTGEYAAVKIIPKDRQLDTTASIREAGYSIVQAIEREIVIMRLLQHPNITNLYGIWESKWERYLVLEYVSGGDLVDYMSLKPALGEDEAVDCLVQIISGLLHMHRLGIYHRDLKHENLMVDRHGNVKIVDFGMAAVQPTGAHFKSACGSLSYVAPEILQNLPYNGSEADVWSLGIVLYGMLTGSLPFDGEDGTSPLLGRIIRGDYNIPDAVSRDASDLISRMLEKDPKRRIALDEIQLHPLVKKHFPGDKRRSPTPDIVHSSQPTSNSLLSDNLDVSTDIISQMRLLWKEQDERLLSDKILSNKMSYEKLFYQLIGESDYTQGSFIPGVFVLHPRPSFCVSFDGIKVLRGKIGSFRLPSGRSILKLGLQPSHKNRRSAVGQNFCHHEGLRSTYQMRKCQKLGVGERTTLARKSRQKPIENTFTNKVQARTLQFKTRNSFQNVLRKGNNQMVAKENIHPKRAVTSLKDAKVKRRPSDRPVNLRIRRTEKPTTPTPDTGFYESLRVHKATRKQGLWFLKVNRPLRMRMTREPRLVGLRRLSKVWRLFKKPGNPSRILMNDQDDSLKHFTAINQSDKSSRHGSTRTHEDSQTHGQRLQSGKTPPTGQILESLPRHIWDQSVAVPVFELQDDQPSTRRFQVYKPLLELKNQLVILLHSWQSYGAGHIRSTSQRDFVWSEGLATLARVSLILSINIVPVHTEDKGTMLLFTRTHGGLAGFNAVVGELVLLVSTAGKIRKSS